MSQPSSREVRAGTQEETEAETTVESCLLAHAHLDAACVGNGTTHRELGLPTSVSNQDTAAQTDQSELRSFSTEVPSSQVPLGCVTLTIKAHPDTSLLWTATSLSILLSARNFVVPIICVLL